MKLKDLILSHHWLSIKITLLQLYPDQEKSIDAYRLVFEKLKQLEPVDYDMSIVLTEHDCDSDDESESNTYVDVSGRKAVNDESSITESYAIEFVEWKNWLGMDLTPETIKNFTELEIIAHCLFEMTFVGYEEEEIQEKFSNIQNDIEAYKNMSDEEKKEQTTSLDDFLKQLNENDENE